MFKQGSLHQADLRCLDEPTVVGDCRSAEPAFSYNPEFDACEKFIYGGCGGSRNRFGREQDCMETCSKVSIIICCLGYLCLGLV